MGGWGAGWGVVVIIECCIWVSMSKGRKKGVLQTMCVVQLHVPASRQGQNLVCCSSCCSVVSDNLCPAIERVKDI
jgi:hypothetical protein